MAQNTRTSPEEIAEVIAETVQETAKDLHYLGKVLKMVAETTVQVMQALQGDKNIDVAEVRARSLRQDAIVWKCVTKLREG